jgi:3-hydroxybutyryl-CoA dehydrogenase
MNATEIKHVTIVGGGLMGCGIAQIFARSGEYNVIISEKFSSEEAVRDRIQSNLKVFVENKIYSEEDVQAIQKNIRVIADLQKSVHEADLIIECIPENMRMKQDLFAELENYCNESTIFATNTSVMSITEIASKTTLKERVVGTHFWNPPYLIPLVEVVKADGTSEEVMDVMMELLLAVGKHPIRVAKDVPGFVANRLQHALWREAISIVEHGIADAKTVDEAIKMSFGLRLPVLAPMENADMVGTDLTLSIHSYILKFLENSPEPSPLLRAKVEQGNLGFKSGEGFMTWSEDAIKQSRDALTQHLIRMLYN